MTEGGPAGLDDSAIDSAVIFRRALEAMAHPGRVVPFARHLNPPAPLYHTTAALCITLCDYDTPLWIEPALRTAQVADYLRFHTGAPIPDDIEGARFIIGSTRSARAWLEAADRGTPEYPDRSATLIIQVDSFVGPGPVALTGPGIDGQRGFRASGIEEEFWRAAAANHAMYPLGADIIFTSPRAVAGLPRSTAIAMAGRN
jgi:alpha-D-ribose 1-methylphosphonate 5-triphosphate synthase subunit PhnH